MAISASSLKAILQAEKIDALGTGVGASDLSTERTRAMDYYLGDMTHDMPSIDGQSKAVSTDVADTVEGLMPPLMEIFASSEEVVRFEPVGPEDEDAAMQETDYVNHVFMQKNPGFMVLYSFIKDALLSKVGVVKVFWDEGEKEERETYLDQPDDVYAALVAEPDIEVAEHTENKGEDGVITHDVTLVTKKKYGCAKAEPVPPEEFGIARRARSLKDAHYCYHEVHAAEDDLIAQGFDAEQVKKLPSAGIQETPEKQARNTVEQNDGSMSGDSGNKAARYIKVTEHYIRMDYEEDETSRLYRVTTGGDQGEVLTRDGKDDVTPVDVMPFAAMTPVIMTHRFFGRSIADLVMDIQRIKTALVRAQLTNIYLMNNQRYEVAEAGAHERTLDDLLVNRPGGAVRVKVTGTVTPLQNQPLGNIIFPALEYWDATREWRTGVTRQGQGIDANALQNQSATAVNQAFTAAQARMKLIARIFAETGIRDLFSLLHATIRKNDTQANTVRLRNKWVQVDPREWKTRDDMTINVGLGTGSRQEQVMNLTNILNIQKELIMSPDGAFKMLVEPKNVYETLKKLCERIGLKTEEPYFSDPTGPQMGPDGKPVMDPQTGQPQMKQPPQPPPDPKVMQIQMQAQLDQKSAENKAQIEQVQAQADMATTQQKIQAESAQTEREFQLKKELAIMTAQIEMEKFNREEARKDREHQQKMDMAREQHGAQMQQAQFGLAAGAQTHQQKMEQMDTANANAGAE